MSDEEAELHPVTVAELVAAVKRTRAALPYEVGAFVALEVCEALIDAPAEIDPRQVTLSDEGFLTVDPALPSASRADAAASVVRLLAHVLVAASAGVPPTMLALIEAEGENRPQNLRSLQEQLITSLVPLNRSASRRVLARLVRSARKEAVAMAERAKGGGSEAEALDQEVDELLGGAPGQVSAPAQPQAAARESAASVEAPRPRRSLPGDQGGRRSWGMWAIPLVAFVAVASGVAIWLTSAAEEVEPSADLPSLSAALDPGTAAADTPSAAKTGTLVLRSAPPGAEVFVRIGATPTEASGVPVGVAQEFLLLVEGQQATRTMISADAVWSDDNAGLLLELELPTGAPLAGPLDLGTSSVAGEPEPASGTASGRVKLAAPGSGGVAYRRLGRTPELRVAGFAVDRESELLFYRPGYALSRSTVKPAAWQTRDGQPRAEILVELRPVTPGG